jgi:hypothetical protein
MVIEAALNIISSIEFFQSSIIKSAISSKEDVNKLIAITLWVIKLDVLNVEETSLSFISLFVSRGDFLVQSSPDTS